MEKTFYHDPEISVTSARIVARGESVPLEQVLSIEQTVDYPRLIGLPALLLGAALIGGVVELVRGGRGYALLCAVFALLGVAGVLLSREFYTISVVGPNGSLAVYVSKNQERVRFVRAAIEVAISGRDEKAPPA